MSRKIVMLALALSTLVGGFALNAGSASAGYYGGYGYGGYGGGYSYGYSYYRPRYYGYSYGY